MKGGCVALLLCLLAAAVTHAESPAVAAARQAAASGNFALAVQNYQQALERGGFSAPVLVSLGDAWLRLGKPGPAILAYERALVLVPGSSIVQAHLASARQRAGIVVNEPGEWGKAARSLSFDTYVWAGLVALWVLCLSVVMLCLPGVPRGVARAMVLLSAVTLCGCADAAALCWSDLYRAVVQSGGSLHLAPAESAAANGSVREGEIVWLQERYAGFSFVRTADGHTGWISESAAVPVRVSRP